MSKRKINVSVDGVAFDSVKEVSQLCDIKLTSLYWYLNEDHLKKCNRINGYTVKSLGDHSFNLVKEEKLTKRMKSVNSQKKVANNKSVQVKCIETGKIYPNITAIANKLGVNPWTMGVKMEETGKFIDKQGNSYIRLRPMVKRSNRQYNTKFSSITRDIQRTCKSKTDVVSNINDKQSISTKDMIIKNLVKSANLMTDMRNYAHAAQVLNILNDFDK